MGKNQSMHFENLREKTKSYLVSHGLYDVLRGKWKLPASPKEGDTEQVLAECDDMLYDDIHRIVTVIERQQKRAEYKDAIDAMKKHAGEVIQSLTWDEVKNMRINAVLPSVHARVLMANHYDTLNKLANSPNPYKAWHCGRALYNSVKEIVPEDAWDEIETNLGILCGLRKAEPVDNTPEFNEVSFEVFRKIKYEGVCAIFTKELNNVFIGTKAYVKNKLGEKIAVSVVNIICHLDTDDIPAGMAMYLFKVVDWD